jgi:hypothetical protein
MTGDPASQQRWSIECESGMMGATRCRESPPVVGKLCGGRLPGFAREGRAMARKIVNRKELRREGEAAEASDGKAVAKTAKKAPAKRKSRAKAAKDVRLKAFWGVFNQSLKRVALFEYSERKAADKKAAELTTSQKTPHFVQPVKEAIAE